MKILMMSEKFAPDIGGVAASSGRIAGTLADLGHETHVIVLARELPGGRVQTGKEGNVTVHRFGLSKNLDFTLQQVSNFVDWIHQKQSIDLVWVHYLGALGFLGVWTAAERTVPALVSIRGNDLDRGVFPPGDFARLRWCLERAKIVCTVTQQLAAKVATLVGREAQVLPNAVDTKLFSPGEPDRALRHDLGISDQELVLGFSGELRAKKGVGFLVGVLRELVARRPTRLLVIGEVRPKERAEYERSIAGDKSLSASVTITGHISDSAEVVRTMHLWDIMVLPSLWDGMPNSLLESMACGIPVIASDAGGIPEVLKDGVNGTIVPRSHLHCLVDSVEQLLSKDKVSRDMMTQAALETVRTNHSLEKERSAIDDMVQKAVSSSS